MYKGGIVFCSLHGLAVYFTAWSFCSPKQWLLGHQFLHPGKKKPLECPFLILGTTSQRGTRGLVDGVPDRFIGILCLSLSHFACRQAESYPEKFEKFFGSGKYTTRSEVFLIMVICRPNHSIWIPAALPHLCVLILLPRAAEGVSVPQCFIALTEYSALPKM